MNPDICDCTSFDEGDWVECKLNSDQFGIIINESDFGRYYTVQLAGSMDTKVFHYATIRHMDEFDVEVPPAARVDGDNVIDFTTARDLRKSTPTKGAA